MSVQGLDNQHIKITIIEYQKDIDERHKTPMNIVDEILKMHGARKMNYIKASQILENLKFDQALLEDQSHLKELAFIALNQSEAIIQSRTKDTFLRG